MPFHWVPQFIAETERIFTTKPKGTGKILRPRHPRVIAGVCSGIAQYFGWDLATLRILVAVFTVASSGFLILAYAAAWVIIPEGQYALPADARATKS
ncbi:phage shock protein C (PspC) family protein [Granulicella pectinivorans]|jgi:phage shock protein PspC (stress-responsive transcriptional regulator)|uniref:Phage shock protein C (PspC) family protein n=1 Tax=Granulicella pectinivorans TaxID=474950 RepID=A0A1I6MSX2_9BACT|nr:PspC domain-containing protein [Granulicella pectinivorans]SFS18759.1 phage shock protein C (PspC) family protein [Granulicella pectinivorans]